MRTAALRWIGVLVLCGAWIVPAVGQTQVSDDAPKDPHRWLEAVESDRALNWVQAQNEKTKQALQATDTYAPLYERVLGILNSNERIATPSLRGEFVYNFWTDAEHPRGIWRRSPVADYAAGSPSWTVLLDIGTLSEREDVNWAFSGASCLAPAYTRCLVNLSRGGSDATEVREFDVETGTFVENGFRLPEAKHSVAWVHADTLLVATDWGKGSLTESGYARVVKRWTRGTPLTEAEPVYEAPTASMRAAATSFRVNDAIVPAILHNTTIFEAEYYVLNGTEPTRLTIPTDADPKVVGRHLALSLRSDWAVNGDTLAQGSVVAAPFDALLQGEAAWTTVFAPGERQTVRAWSGVRATKTTLLVSTLTNVRGELYRYRVSESGEWTGEKVDLPDVGSLRVVSTSDTDDRFFASYSGFLQPSTLYLAETDGSVRAVQQLGAQFNADGLTVRQHEATSADGTRIPYFIVHREGLALDGTTPTLLYGYGGFQISVTPSYTPVTGAAWLERGGAYVIANIRGGGEFGPAWHQAAQKENRQRSYDDFLAVAEDLIDRGVTAPAHLGIYGGSNGGLLVGAAVTQRPDLFNAAVASIPLLDMKRYHTLLAGASWMAEYGDPDDPEEWAYIREYSPYHNVSADADYPPVFFTTTTRDDRVHPGHARKMAARMLGQGHDVYYFENTEGGHGSGVTPDQRARYSAMMYSYLWMRLGGEGVMGRE